jgi:tetratricopeptide (TPR) repeat protein
MKSCFDPTYHLVRALELEPAHDKAALLRAKLLIQKNEISATIDFIESYLIQYGTHSELNNQLAIAYLERDDIEKADEVISQALCESPRSVDILKTSFLIKKRKGDKFSALHFLERIIRYDENLSETYWEMAKLLDSKTDLAKKINILEITHSLDSENVIFFEELLISYLQRFKEVPSEDIKKEIKKHLYEHSRKPLFTLVELPLKKEVIRIIEND